MKQGLEISWVLIGILCIALVSGLLSVPVWQQNRYLDIMRTQAELQQEKLALQIEIAKVEMGNGQLQSLNRIEPVARTIGLGFYEVPVKVMEIPHHVGTIP